MIARIAVGFVAVLVLAWLGVMERDARIQSRALAEAGKPPAGRAYRDFRRARLLNPDTAPDVLIALLDSVHERHRQAIARLEDVVRREPENLFAWTRLYGIAHGIGDPADRRAYAAMHRLDPLDFPAG